MADQHKVSEHSLLSILMIADMWRREDSLDSAMEKTHYRELRPFFGASDLTPLLHSQPRIVQQWIAYSSDKRTSGGWGFNLSDCRKIGTQLGESLSFSSVPEAAAEFVVRELDFWAEVGDRQRRLEST